MEAKYSLKNLRHEVKTSLDKNELMELRTILQHASRKGYVTGLFSRSSCPLNCKAGKEKVRKAAQNLIDSPTITPAGLKEYGWTKTLRLNMAFKDLEGSGVRSGELLAWRGFWDSQGSR